jgi:hypothetical protein
MANKHKRINYLKVAVEEKIHRKLGDRQYIEAYYRSCKHDCMSMESRINSIVRNL